LILVAAAGALLSLSALAATSVDAARGGKGGKPTPTPAPSTASVTLISANPVPVGTAPTFHATGYAPGVLVYMIMSRYIVQEARYADETGSITYTFYEGMRLAGDYTFTTVEKYGVNPASVSFKVQ
jgi:type IV secretory pathway VirB6-like protein